MGSAKYAFHLCTHEPGPCSFLLFCSFPEGRLWSSGRIGIGVLLLCAWVEHQGSSLL